MGSPEKPMDMEMGDMSDETKKLNPDVDVEQGKKLKDDEPQRFTGLKKEELLEISNQKKWVVARWILFILFWVGWVGMLVGAIIIVINAPRCKKEPDLPWHQDTVVYEANVENFFGKAKLNVDESEMMSRLDYVMNLNTRTLSLNGLETAGDFTMPEDTDALDILVAEARELKYPLKVVASIRVDALTTDSATFKQSAACVNNTGDNCDFFLWESNYEGTVSPDDSGWVESPSRNDRYKVDGAGMAIINYESSDAQAYLTNAVSMWASHVDGLHITSFENVISGPAVVQSVRDTMDTAIEEESETKGLFISADGMNNANLEALYGANQNDTNAPVVFNNQITTMTVPLAGIGDQIKDSIVNWRENNDKRKTGYATNTFSSSSDLLLNKVGGNYSSALTILNQALPGVPIIRSGEETLAPSDEYNWEDGELVLDSDWFLKMMRNVVMMRVKSYASKPSLRWDRADQHTNLTFVDVSNPDMLVFTRKWDTKPTILTVSNLSPNDHVLDFSGIAEKLKVLGSNTELYKEDSTVSKTEELKFPKAVSVIFEI